MPVTESVERKRQVKEARIAVIFKDDRIEVYEVPEHILNELPDVLSPDEVEEAVELVEKVRRGDTNG